MTTQSSAPRAGVTLQPASAAEYADFVDRQIVEYAEEETRAGHWRREEALARSRAETRSFLPEAGPSPGHRVYRAIDATGRGVGWIWLGPPPARFRLPTARWLFQITVEESLRGQGFGRAMLRAAEGLAASEGADALYLNVFAWNVVAKALYDSAGYVVHYDGRSEFGMHKPLARSR